MLMNNSEIIKPNFKAIPASLKQYPNFVLWKALPAIDGKTLTKVPFNAITGKKAKSTDPKTWTTFEKVKEVYERGGYTGIGFVMIDELDLIALDIDNVDTDDLKNDDRVKSLLDKTYCEISPSGKGIRSFIKGNVPHDSEPNFNNRNSGYEGYTSKRFVTLTGKQVSSVDDIATNKELTESIYKQYGTQVQNIKGAENFKLTDIVRIETTAKEVWKRIDKSSNEDKKKRIHDLYNNGVSVISEYNLESHSQADYSLINDLLFYADNDYITVKEIMESSALAQRSKWYEPRKLPFDRSITVDYGAYSIIKMATENTVNNRGTYSTIAKIKAEEEFTTLQKETDAQASTDWIQALEIDKAGKVLPTRTNINLILANDLKIKGAFRYNVFSMKKEIGVKPVWRSKDDDSKEFTDTDEAMLRIYLGTVYGVEADKRIADAVEQQFYKNRYHPIQEYLTGLEWDGTPRVETLFSDYLGAEDTSYNRRIARLMLSGAVARIMTAGVKFDYMVMLLGAQGLGKSTLLKKLAGEYFNDSPIRFGDKEAFLTTQGSWIIEVAELASMNKRDVNEIKQYLSATHDTYRAPYSKHNVTVPRSSILVGTSNDIEVLRDPTGSRRFLIVNVGAKEPIKSIFDITQEEIDQIWSESYTYYVLGEKIHLNIEDDKEVLEEVKQVNAKHMEDDGGLKALIEEYLSNPIPSNSTFYDMSKMEDEQYLDRISARVVWREIMGNMGEPTRIQVKNINNALKSITMLEPKDSVRIKGYGRGRGFIVLGRYKED
ncbi:VapE family protein [Macrococcus capreoli]